jgi:hypothetical protein
MRLALHCLRIQIAATLDGPVNVAVPGRRKTLGPAGGAVKSECQPVRIAATAPLYRGRTPR